MSRCARYARLGRPDQQPPRARDAPADRGDARRRSRGGGDRARVRADARAVRALRDRPHRGRPPPRRAAGRQGARPGLAQPGAGALGARAALRRGPRSRLQRRERGRRPAAHPERHGLRLRVGQGPAPGELPPRPGGGGARRDPARAPGALRRRGQDPRLSGAQGGVLPGRLRARPGRAGRAGPRSRADARDRAHPARGVALSPLREPAVPARARAPGRGGRAGGGAPAHGRAARGGGADRPLHGPRARGRRAEPRGATPTWWSQPAVP